MRALLLTVALFMLSGCTTLAAGALFASQTLVPRSKPRPPTTMVRGQSRSCFDLPAFDQQLNAPNTAYFKDWSESDFQSAETWIVVCRNQVDNAKITEQRLDNLASMQTIERDRQIQVAAAIKRAQACMATNAFQLYQSEIDVINALRQEAYADNLLAQERRVSNASGVENLIIKYAYGQMKVQAIDALDSAWNSYRRLGGHANTPESVTISMANPCMVTTAQ